MEVKYRTSNGQFEVNFEVKDASSLFEAVADFQEVFEDGAFYTILNKEVPASDVQFRVRLVDDNKYFEKVYVGKDKELWGFKLPYGQNKKGGGLFPKRKFSEEDAKDNVNGYNGWRKFKGQQQGDSEPAKEDKGSKSKTEKAPF
jgi:hypothetical protein